MRALLLVFSLRQGPHRAPSDSWLGEDKVQHFLTSAFVQTLSYGALRGAGIGHGGALVTASITSLGVGLGKEVYDARHHGDVSRKDVVWDVAGAATVSVLLARTAR